MLYMELNVVGHLLGEKNPMFGDPSMSLGNNGIKYLIISCFEQDDIDKFKNIVRTNNAGKALEDRMSFPIMFERGAVHVMCKFRNHRSDSLLKKIDFLSGDLRQLKLPDWIGKKFIIRAKVFKYKFIEKDPDLIKGGSSIERKGYTYHVKNIKLFC
jgi:hypothetical protein